MKTQWTWEARRQFEILEDEYPQMGADAVNAAAGEIALAGAERGLELCRAAGIEIEPPAVVAVLPDDVRAAFKQVTGADLAAIGWETERRG